MFKKIKKLLGSYKTYKREEIESIVLQVGDCRLDQRIGDFKGKLEEVSSEIFDSGLIVRPFSDEQVFKADPIIFLNINWERYLAVTNGMIYKIALSGSPGSGVQYDKVKSYFYDLYGRPEKIRSKEPVILIMWRIPFYDPEWNLVIQKSHIDDSVSIFLTSGKPFKSKNEVSSLDVIPKTFKNSEKREADKIIKDVERKLRPISDLSKVILLSSYLCAEALKPYLDAPTQKQKDALSPAVCFEFIYFFAHLMNRFALSILSNAGRIKLQEEIAPFIVGPAISAFFDHWPSDIKEKMTDHLFEDLNESELDYSSCREIVPPSIQILFEEVLESEPSSAKYLFSKLIGRIYALSEKSLSNEALLVLFEVSTKAYVDMKLKEHMDEIKKVL